MKLHLRKTHPLEWLLEPLESLPGYLRKKMFGCEAVYMNGKLSLVLAAGDEPWNGILIPTEREFHSALQQEWKPLSPHPVLGKWLYLSQAHSAFEAIGAAVVDRVKRGDPRIGVEPKPKRRQQRQTKP